jgi:hypothetical protein
MNKKTILISSYHSLISRNILQSDILPILLKRGFYIVVLCHRAQHKYIQSLVGAGVEVVPVDYTQRRIDRIVQLFSMGLVTNYNLFMRRIWQEGQYSKVILMQILYYTLHSFSFCKKVVRWFYQKYASTNSMQNIFATYNPELVFATDIFNFDDVKLLNEAKQCGIRTVGMVRSWDNPTTRGVLLSIPDKVLCWNEIIKEELVDFHGVKVDMITVTGIPHHDKIDTPPAIEREEFLESMGLNPNKKTIFIAPGGKMQYIHDGEILRLLQRLKDVGRFVYPIQFLVRQQPGDLMVLDGFDSRSDSDFVIHEPGQSLSGRKKENEISKKDDDSLINSIRYSDIILTLVSSVILDATFYDKPGIIFLFDPKKGLPDTPRKFVRYKHMKRLFDSELLTVSRSEQEFVEQVNAYLNNSKLNHDKRMALSEKYAYKIDGHSSERVVKVLLKNR